MTVVIRAAGTRAGNAYFFKAVSWVKGSNVFTYEVKNGLHEVGNLQADFDNGETFRLSNMGGFTEPEADKFIAKQASLPSGLRYHGEVEPEPEKAVVVLDQCTDAGEVVFGWPSVDLACKVHGVKKERLLEAIETGEMKYGFVWKLV